MLQRLHPETPEVRHLKRILERFDQGAVIVYPTDSGYSMGCDASNKAALKRLYHIKRGMKRYMMALMARDFSSLTDYVEIGNESFRIMRRLVPGPYTFILPATAQGKKRLDVNRPEIGVRMPNCLFGNSLFALKPDLVLLTTAARIHEADSYIDPWVIEEAFGKQVDMVVDLGNVPNNPTTVLSLVGRELEVIREGQGVLP